MRMSVTIWTCGSSCKARLRNLIFPIRPPRDAQHPERMIAAIHRNHTAIIDKGGLLRGSVRIFQFFAGASS